MTGRDVTTSFATVLVDEWARAGIADAVVAPGSRNSPLTLALARDSRIRVQVVLDERSAGFRALGLAAASGRPVVVGCTSGTAAANLHPAVVEASHAGVPLLVCTADRPPELRDVGAGQTIDQTNLFGSAARWFCDPGPPEAIADAGVVWRSLASRAVAEATGPTAGPVHLNLPFREPLLPTGEPLVDAPGRANDAAWTRVTRVVRAASPDDVHRLAATIRAHERGVVAVGWRAQVSPATVRRFAAAARWPVLADAISGARSGDAISTYEALLRDAGFAGGRRPDLVVRAGAPLTSKVANQWLAGAGSTLTVDPDGRWLDPSRVSSELVRCDAELLLAALADELEREPSRAAETWHTGWLTAERRARDSLDTLLDKAETPFEGRVARDVAAASPDGAVLLVASSLPVRALEWCMAPRDGLTVMSNRGANGIDGFVSTAAGIASSGVRTVAFCGDLCFLHDVNGLLGLGDLDLTFVVVDNDGGGIFSFLPPAELPEFESLFATPQGVDLVEVARAHGARAERVGLTELPGALANDGMQVLVVTVERDESVRRHRELWDAVATSLA